jgi:hypothetical protein
MSRALARGVIVQYLGLKDLGVSEAVGLPSWACLLQNQRQVGSLVTGEEVATPGEQTTDTHRILWNFIAPHATIAFFNPPIDGALTGIVSPIELFALGPFPLSTACQAMPQVPAIQKPES